MTVMGSQIRRGKKGSKMGRFSVKKSQKVVVY